MGFSCKAMISVCYDIVCNVMLLDLKKKHVRIQKSSNISEKNINITQCLSLSAIQTFVSSVQTIHIELKQLSIM